MRTEKEMLDVILRVAKEDNRILAVYMNGSRTNHHVPKDIFQDYDIVYVVEEITSFLEEPSWIDVFGELLMIQEPDKNDQLMGLEVDLNTSYGYLMLFSDGNRIDLRLQIKEEMLREFGNDSLTMPLLDKLGILPVIPQSSDKNYHVRKPSIAQYRGCCNNFWWCLQNVAKGIWRDELPYAKQMFEWIIRDELNKMVNWWIGSKHGYTVSPGKMGKYYQKFLPASYWEMYKETYSDSDYDQLWDSLFVTCDLFRSLAKDVGHELKIQYPEVDDRSMVKYLKQIRYLPKDSEGIF